MLKLLVPLLVCVASLVNAGEKVTGQGFHTKVCGILSVEEAAIEVALLKVNYSPTENAQEVVEKVGDTYCAYLKN